MSLRARCLWVLGAVPLLAGPVLDGEITGPEKLSSGMCSSGQVLVKGATVWGCGTLDARQFLGADVTEATGAAHTTVFTVPLEMEAGKAQAVRVVLIQATSLGTTSVQNRVQLSGANATGACTFVTSLGGSLEVDTIALGTGSADTGNISGHLSTDPFVATIDCAVLASNTNATDLVVSFQAETADTVTTYAGSWYEHVSD